VYFLLERWGPSGRTTLGFAGAGHFPRGALRARHFMGKLYRALIFNTTACSQDFFSGIATVSPAASRDHLSGAATPSIRTSPTSPNQSFFPAGNAAIGVCFSGHPRGCDLFSPDDYGEIVLSWLRNCSGVRGKVVV
jgi:hypothetical protein